ncbi:MAG TPA: FAD-dependent oxidoreductase, partial [Croceibacterium sp.]|nr:FAD-dependent oxidoreductase [Croceibacterium sp.]
MDALTVDAEVQSVRETRATQMFPTLSADDIARIRRFGTPRKYAAGETVARTGQTGLGLGVVLSGEVCITQGKAQLEPTHVVTHHAGSFTGELAQLSGRPALVDAVAVTDSEILLIPPERLRALLVAEADLGERIMRALILRRVGLIEAGGTGPVLIGRAGDAYLHGLENFLRRNGHPHVRLDPEEDNCAETLLARFHVDEGELPIVLCPNGDILRRPSESALARCLGMVGTIDPERVYDVVIVGAGPAGLAASVYAASEGLEVLTLDCRSFGGQAGASARIENFLGFPTGISGMALMARAYNQAQKFGVEMAIPDEAARLECPDGVRTDHLLTLANGETARGRAVVVATGARYRRLDLDGIAEFEGSAVHFWASPIEARLCLGEHVMLVGGGNSAGQAAVFLSGKAARVTMLARRPLAETMSRYLIERIAAQPNITLVEGAEVDGVEGADGRLERVRIRHRADGSHETVASRHLFLFIGAEPNTDWLAKTGIRLDERGFVKTGADVGPDRHALETSRSGIFAIGDVRSGSVKRVAAAAGDGAQVIAAVHQYLA